MSSIATLEKIGIPPESVFGLLERAAELHPQARFLMDSGGSLTYGDALEQVRRLAGCLHSLGVKRGDRVAVCCRNRSEIAVAVFAAAALGAIFVVLNSRLKSKGLAKILAQAEPSALVADEATWDQLPAAAEDIAIKIRAGEAGASALPAGWIAWSEAAAATPFTGGWPGVDVDPACLVFTSGSTGEPRGVTLSHDNITFVVAAIQRRLRYREDDVIGCYLPLAFDYGLYQIFLAAFAGAALQVGDPDQAGPRLPSLLREAGVTVLPGVPALCAALIALHQRRPFQLPRLRAVTNTGERLPSAYIARLLAMLPGIDVHVMYGLTECKRVSIMLPGELAAKPDAVGRPLDGTEVYAVDAEGRSLPPGETGELVVIGRHVALGYWRAPEESARRFRKRAPESPVELFTGDKGRVDAEGFLYFAARADDLIKHRGNRVSPAEIEMEACAVAGVGEASLLKRDRDDTIHLFVTVTEPALDSPAILASLSEVLEPAKIPDFVHLQPALPKSLNGKIDRHALKERLDSLSS